MSDVSLLDKHKFVVNNQITVHIPTIKEIRGDSPILFGTDKDEADFYSLVNLFSATSSDIMVELDEMGIDFTTWSDFTQKIFELSNVSTKVNPITSEEYSKMYPTSANRPKNSQLSKDKLLSNGIVIPSWEDALERYLKKEGRM